MDINKLPEIWSRYDKHLSDNLDVNTDLLRHLRLDRSDKELSKPAKFEVFSVCVYITLAIFVFSLSLRMVNDSLYSIPGFIATGILILYTVFGIKKIILISTVDFFSTPVLQIQKQISKMTIVVLRLRKTEIGLLIPLAITIIPILFKVLYNIDIYKNWGWLVFELAILIVVGCPAMFLFNKYWYDRKIMKAQHILSQIETFQKEP